jgi:ankyrin repeat protein
MRKDFTGLLAAIGVALMVPTAAGAQATRNAYGADGYGFVEAVKGRDSGKVLNYLQSNGAAAMINFRNDKGESALTVVTARRDSDWLAFFLAKGGDPNIANAAGDTPLHLAARGGWDEGVQTLLTYRVAVDRGNKLGETPLIAAVQARQLPIIRRLLMAGASPDRRDNASGRSARDYARLDTRSGGAILTLMDTIKGRASRPIAGPKL